MKKTGVELEDSYETLWGYDETAKDCMKRNTKEGILEVHWTTGSGNWGEYGSVQGNTAVCLP